MHLNILLLLVATAFCLTTPSLRAGAQSSPRTFSERHVMRSLRLLHSAQATYQATLGAGDYGSLQSLRQAGFIDGALATGEKYGFVYVVTLVPGPPRNFIVTATPLRYRKTGIRSFFIDAGGEIHGADKQGQPASSSDPIIDDCTSGTVIENERCTILDMRVLAGAQSTYAATAGSGDYGLLPELYIAGLIRGDLADNTARGYNYQVQTINHAPGQPASFKIWATPQIYGVTAIRSFYIDQTDILRGGDKKGGQANQNDPPVDK